MGPSSVRSGKEYGAYGCDPPLVKSAALRPLLAEGAISRYSPCVVSFHAFDLDSFRPAIDGIFCLRHLSTAAS
jgi:hypothetical protein